MFDVFRGSYKDLDKNVTSASHINGFAIDLKRLYVLNVFMVFVVEYVIIVFRSLKPRDSNPVSSPTARPDSRV